MKILEPVTVLALSSTGAESTNIVGDQFLRIYGAPTGGMRGDYDILRIPQGRIGGERFGCRHVQRSARNRAGV